MKLSIIICVYNTDKGFLDECLHSITASTLATPQAIERDDIEYEIVMVDDGSKIDYSDLVEKYRINYTKTENRGIFKARILGAQLASGDYITYCDSDDTVSFNYHLPMLLEAEKKGADIVMNDWAFRSVSARYACHADSSIITDIDCDGDDVLLRFSEQRGKEHSFYVLWNKIYARDVLKAAAISAHESVGDIERFNYAEDVLINFFAFKAAKKLVNIHTGYYFYRLHPSQSVNVISAERLKSQVDFLALVIDVMYTHTREHKYSEEIAKRLNDWKNIMARTHYSHACAGKYKQLFPYIKEVYKVKKLRKTTLDDESTYAHNKLLPTNFEEFDEILFDIWKCGGGAIAAKKMLPFVERTLAFMRSAGIPVQLTSDGKAFPKAQISFKKRIVYNPIIYKIAMVLFKKGGKIRNFLKKRM